MKNGPYASYSTLTPSAKVCGHWEEFSMLRTRKTPSGVRSSASVCLVPNSLPAVIGTESKVSERKLSTESIIFALSTTIIAAFLCARYTLSRRYTNVVSSAGGHGYTSTSLSPSLTSSDVFPTKLQEKNRGHANATRARYLYNNLIDKCLSRETGRKDTILFSFINKLYTFALVVLGRIRLKLT